MKASSQFLALFWSGESENLKILLLWTLSHSTESYISPVLRFIDEMSVGRKKFWVVKYASWRIWLVPAATKSVTSYKLSECRMIFFKESNRLCLDAVSAREGESFKSMAAKTSGIPTYARLPPGMMLLGWLACKVFETTYTLRGRLSTWPVRLKYSMIRDSPSIPPLRSLPTPISACWYLWGGRAGYSSIKRAVYWARSTLAALL